MRYLKCFAVLAVVLSSACINLPEIEQVPESPDGGEPDVHVEDSGTPDASVPDSGTSSLVVTLVTSRSITNSNVQISATVTGSAPDEVELLVDGVVVATLAPPYELRWSAQSLDEGPHMLSVRATLGERRFTSESRTLVVDRTRPRWVSQTPLAGSQAISVHQTILAIFSEPLEPTTVNTESVKLLSDAGGVAANVVLAPEGTSLTILPASLLPIDATLQVSLDGTVTDLAGNPVEPLQQDWTWTVPGYLPLGEPLSASPTESSEVRSSSLQIDGSGQPVVAWLDGTASAPYGVRVNRWTGSKWEQLGGVLGGIYGSYYSTFCALEIDGNKRPVVVWDEYSQSGTMSFPVRRWNGVTWEMVGTQAVTLGNQVSADLVVFKGNGKGQLALAFRELTQGGRPISVWRWDGSAWGKVGEALNVNPDSAVSGLRMAMGIDGNPVVAWGERDSSGWVAAYMKYWTGTAWKIINLPTQAYPGVLSADASGAPVLDVPTWDGIARSAQLQRWNGAYWETLGDPISLYPGATDSGVAALTLDAQGRLVALVVEEEVADGPQVLYVRRWNAGAWEPVGSQLRKTPGLIPVQVSFALDSSDQPIVARSEQSESEPGRRRVHVYRPNN
ncbi:Ig-like domain-containing protein [Myxococcus sp. RHSTA-1-4]|uniref:Ig-like domain-containing protein n=1 Tax=Myxococcus sp. RHSTA-1-4 TaxID=2874601 RepID=UPI001CBB92BA|nr:Ig-like domain-containing protein [Myxococcus sp. RHSTA-1-4]MBZ4420322.1 Ig-like domain-containing protein [Myxococcus sp. RHSTA-1-4]